ncbi:DUF3139 domain-containing protein [Psychrobacillus sp. OK032]|uniref:DUF3139 domain-containing protein n=1 Tax=Psychrobacillus sp. OK032 TaxID=1884358 RepID=UPI0008D41485|nr:DUF3139 domain-containing protein [Psychrobacillus sp. OK032]SES37357.1 hypothetical protein SAMN05518872_10957 [Psychrobacillus sp. OK032]
MKKFGTVLLIFLIIVGIIFSYIQYKKSTVEESVINYLITEKNIPNDDIISSEPFIANLQGDKNWMVSVKLKDDEKTYFYYKNKGEVVLESYIENGVEYVQ